MDGIVNFFKPKGMTSHDAVYYFRRLYKTRKVGHTGTLDPMATGVLPICIGKATRVSEYLLNVGKEYIGELTLGSETDTQDKEGKIINYSNKEISEEDIKRVFNDFKGSKKQIPPMFSAKKIDGKKLYELAREGIIIERNANDINISELKILDIIDNKRVLFYAKVSKGTYIRTLCTDLGLALGTYGHMSYLLRVGVGTFKLSDSYGMETLNQFSKEDKLLALLPMDKALDHLKEIKMDAKDYKHLTNGLKLRVSSYEDIIDNEPVRVYSGDEFIGIGKLIDENNTRFIKMDKVLIRW